MDYLALALRLYRSQSQACLEITTAMKFCPRTPLKHLRRLISWGGMPPEPPGWLCMQHRGDHVSHALNFQNSKLWSCLWPGTVVSSKTVRDKRFKQKSPSWLVSGTETCKCHCFLLNMMSVNALATWSILFCRQTNRLIPRLKTLLYSCYTCAIGVTTGLTTFQEFIIY